MSESLDLLAARAVYAAGLFERAVHDPGPWTVTWGPYEVDALRIEQEDGVVFEALFPETCWLTDREPSAVLRCRGMAMAVRPIEAGDASFAITWALRARVLAHDGR